MDEGRPFVSIITPTHNRAAYIGEAITSVLSQTYSNFEMLIVDNGSTDNTKEIVHSFRDERIRYFHQCNSGSPVSPRNRGLSLAKGEIISFLDSDDVWLPEKLTLQVAELRKNGSLGMVYSDCFLIDESGKMGDRYSDFHRPHKGDILTRLLRSNFIPSATVSIRQSVLDESGYLNETFQIVHDLDLYLRVANCYQVGYIEEPLAKLRVHGVSLTRNRVRTRVETLELIELWCLDRIEDKLPLFERRSILAHHCFRAGLEMLGSEEHRKTGRALLHRALCQNIFDPLYWVGCLLAVLPLVVVQQVMRIAKRRWSIECMFH